MRPEEPLPWHEKSRRRWNCICNWLFALLSRQIENIWCSCLEGKAWVRRRVWCGWPYQLVSLLVFYLPFEIDHIKSFGKINCLCQCTEWRTRHLSSIFRSTGLREPDFLGGFGSRERPRHPLWRHFRHRVFWGRLLALCFCWTSVANNYQKNKFFIINYKLANAWH